MFRVRSIAAIVGLIFVALVAFAPMASAQTDDEYPLGTTPPTVIGTDVERGAGDPAAADPAAADPAAAVAAQVQSSGQSLPVTGGDVLGLTALGLIAVGAGFALVRYQRSTATRV